jgi:Rad3-related DNA helicase/DNA polymerase III epsilon subunit-like protein
VTASTGAESTSSALAPLRVERHAPGDVEVELAPLDAFLRATGPLAVVDLETTGLAEDPQAEILEFGAVLLDPGSEVLTTLEGLVHPRGPLPRAVQRLTGLSPADVEHAPAVEELAKPIAAALAGRSVVAHNAAFERHFLARFVAGPLGDLRYLDTQDLLALTHPDAPDLRLETFTRALLTTEERHRALSDALDTLRVLARAAAGAARGERRFATARSALESFAPQSPWLPLLSGPPFAAEAEPPPFVAIPASREAPVPFDPDAIAAALADEARGRRHFEGYRVREQQIRMAREFAQVLGRGGRLLLEGGTGVGKSLAYLAALIPFAMQRAADGIRGPVLVSTRTKLLQDQLLGKDIPAAAALLGYPELRALSIKGRANYVCARRLEAALAEGREPRIFAEDRLAYAALAACARTRRHGEIGTLPGALLFRFPALRDLRRRSVAARAEQCSRDQCARERGCPFGRRRAALAEAHLAVANHDLLLRWPPDYPEIAHVVADEAHELPGVADEVFARWVEPVELLDRFDELVGRPGEEGATAALLPRGRLRAASRDLKAWRRGLQQDLVALGRALADRASEYGELQLPYHPARIHPEAALLAQRAAERLEAAAGHGESLAGEAGEDAADAARRSAGELREAARALRDAFAGGDDDSVAAFEGLEPPFERWRLAVRQVAPAPAFHERFADRLESLACVSASLFVGGDVFASLGELELETGMANERVQRVSVESPFPYPQHMRVAALEPSGGGDLVEETAEVLARLARLLSGRTLGLFTSLRRMRDVGELLAEKLRGEGFDVLAPRRATDDPAALVERFSRAGTGGVLLGARTFWQGLDIPGPALQAVVIEKLPFEVPTELRKRRQARLEQAGEDAFDRYTLGKMLLNLKQMTGRLIRTEDDRGIVVIVDARPDKSYFRRLSDALPAGCGIERTGLADLPRLLREVGIEPAASPGGPP